MNFSSLFTKGTIAGVLGFCGIVATNVFHLNALGAFFSDPATADNLMNLINSALVLYAGMAPGIKPAVPPAA